MPPRSAIAKIAAGTIPQPCCVFSTAITIAAKAPAQPSERSRSPAIAGSSAARARMKSAVWVPSRLPRFLVVGNRSGALKEKKMMISSQANGRASCSP